MYRAFIMGCCWCFTRPYAALVLFLIATSGAILCPTGTWPLVVMWMGMSVGVFLFYFVFLPDAEEVPYWCETVGPLKASMDPKDWERLAREATSSSITSPYTAAPSYQYEYVYSSTVTGGGVGGAKAPTNSRKSISV